MSQDQNALMKTRLPLMSVRAVPNATAGMVPNRESLPSSSGGSLSSWQLWLWELRAVGRAGAGAIPWLRWKMLWKPLSRGLHSFTSQLNLSNSKTY